MRAILPLLVVLAAPAAADSLPEVEAALDRAIADQRLLFTCETLDREALAFLAEQWAVAVSETVAALTAGGYDAEAVRAFEARAEPEALQPAPDATFLEVRDACWAAAKDVEALRFRWSQTFSISELPEALPPPFGKME